MLPQFLIEIAFLVLTLIFLLFLRHKCEHAVLVVYKLLICVNKIYNAISLFVDGCEDVMNLTEMIIMY